MPSVPTPKGRPRVGRRCPRQRATLRPRCHARNPILAWPPAAARPRRIGTPDRWPREPACPLPRTVALGTWDPSIDDEQLRTDVGVRAVGFLVIGDLVAHARAQRELAAVLQLGVQLALGTQEDVALHAPMIREITRGVLDHANAQGTEVLRAPIGESVLALVLDGLDLRPIGRSEGNSRHLHSCTSPLVVFIGARRR